MSRSLIATTSDLGFGVLQKVVSVEIGLFFLLSIRVRGRRAAREAARVLRKRWGAGCRDGRRHAASHPRPKDDSQVITQSPEGSETRGRVSESQRAGEGGNVPGLSSSDSEVVVLLIAYILSSETNVIAKGWLDGRMLLRYAHTHPLAPRLWDPLSRRWLDGCVRQRVDIGALGVRVVLRVVLGHWWKCAHVYWKGWEHFL